MSERAQSTTQTVSLFPFLAVLVCAMGALILLLLVTTRRVRQVAIVRARAAQMEALERQRAVEPKTPEPAKPVPAAPSQADQERRVRQSEAVEDARRRIEELRQDRERKQQRLSKVPARFGEARTRFESAASELAALNSRLKRLEQERRNTVQAAAAMENEHGALLTQVAGVEEQIQQSRHRLANARSKFAIVPYDGQSGTTRRPILIECRDDAIRFIPENVVLTPQDLDGFTVGYNPLLAGAGALVEYWSAQSAKHADPLKPDPEPYVLLIVRPDGSVPFYVARRLLQSLNQPFGYELLEKDCELDLPVVDPDARRACAAAVERTLSQREKVDEAINAGRVRSGEQMHFRSGASGFAEARLQDADDPRERAGQSRQPRTGIPAPYGLGWDGEDDRIPGIAQSGRDTGGSPLDPGQSISEETENPGTLPPAVDPSSRPTSLGLNGGFDFEKGIAESAVGQPLLGQQSWERSSLNNPLPGLKRSNVNPPGDDVPSEMMIPEREQRDARPPDVRAAGPKIYTFDKQSAAGGSVTGSAGGFQKWNGSVKDARSDAPTPADGATGGIGEALPSGIESGLPSFGNRAERSPPAEDIDTWLARNRWGFSAHSGTIGFERPVEINVLADRIIVANELFVMVGRGESREDLLKAAAAGIDRHVRSWGKPPDNFYWVPGLQFVVSPGGIQHYERMHGAFRKAGLFSTVRFTLESDNLPELPHASESAQ